jgi:predicted TIM-barrel fold metal-dependent hydrolase
MRTKPRNAEQRKGHTPTAGEDDLVIGSNYGHADAASEIAAPRELNENAAVGLSAVAKILADNAAALYGI